MNELEAVYYTGCLLGGAVGDALGAPIEFLTLAQIRQHYGKQGVTGYVEGPGRQGAFTDDTQMTLFTAEGLLRAGRQRDDEALVASTYQAYLRWLHTQEARLGRGEPDQGIVSGWLLKEKGLYSLRAPGNTCLSALRSGECGVVGKRLNNSKGCGGIMRAAPAGLMFYDDTTRAFKVGCDVAAITHSHPSGYLSAGFLAALLAGIIQQKDLMTAINDATSLLTAWKDHQETLMAVEQAVTLYHTAEPTGEHVEQLGGGWVGEETLAISLFCALHFQDDFRGGVLTAVNHSGDCDSTGAVVGNILGLLMGEPAIPQEWRQHLAMVDTVRGVAIDLYCGAEQAVPPDDPTWLEKYPPA
jgi:ADP-ribosylglycohydrolase